MKSPNADRIKNFELTILIACLKVLTMFLKCNKKWAQKYPIVRFFNQKSIWCI